MQRGFAPIFNRQKRTRQALTSFPEGSLAQSPRISSDIHSESKYHEKKYPIEGNNRLTSDVRIVQSGKSYQAFSQIKPGSSNAKVVADSRYPKMQKTNAPSAHQRPEFASRTETVTSSKKPGSNSMIGSSTGMSIPYPKPKVESFVAGKKSISTNSSDRSLHVILCRITDIDRCTSVNKSAIPLLFEIFGVVDSATTSSGSCGREFIIKDNTSRLHCVFHEIDRSLSRLMRGVTYRCVGSYNGKELKCLSVRQATAQETQFAQNMAGFPARIIGEITRAAREQ